MRRYRGPFIAGLLAVLLFSGCPAGAEDSESPQPGQAELRVGTFNVHYVADGQERLAWDRRKGAVAAALREGAADIVAFQEMETFDGGRYSDRNVQLAYLRQQFPEYAFAAVGAPRNYPWTQPIMYRADRFEPLEQGFFFFSPTPDQIYSEPWAGRYPAFCSWVRFRDLEEGKQFYLYNIHFDYESRENRLRSAALLADRLEARNHSELPALVAGDFNAPWFFKPVRTLEESGLEVAPTAGSTVHFYRGINLIPAIDHLLFSPGFEAVRTEVLRSKYAGVWPSDHYPVFVELRWAP